MHAACCCGLALVHRAKSALCHILVEVHDLFQTTEALHVGQESVIFCHFFVHLTMESAISLLRSFIGPLLARCLPHLSKSDLSLLRSCSGMPLSRYLSSSESDLSLLRDFIVRYVFSFLTLFCCFRFSSAFIRICRRRV